MDQELDRTYNPFAQPCPEFEAFLDSLPCAHRRYSWPSKEANYAFCDDCEEMFVPAQQPDPGGEG